MERRILDRAPRARSGRGAARIGSCDAGQEVGPGSEGADRAGRGGRRADRGAGDRGGPHPEYEGGRGLGHPGPAEATASSTPDPEAATEVRDGNFSFVITGVERVDAVADQEFPEIQKAAQGEYVIVKMTVTNVGNEPQTFFASFNTLSDGSTVYQSDDEAWIYLGNTLADLNPGDSVDTAVVFDVPRGTDVESIELHDGPFSDGVTVGL